jgi:hypothetical protein
MDGPSKVTDLVDALDGQALREPLLIGRESVHLRAEAVHRDDGRAPTEVGLTEHEGKDRSEEIQVDDAYDSFVLVTIEPPERFEKTSAVELTTGGVVGEFRIQREFSDVDSDAQDRLELAGERLQLL